MPSSHLSTVSPYGSESELKSHASTLTKYYNRKRHAHKHDWSRYISPSVKLFIKGIQSTKIYLVLLIACTIYALFAFDFNLWVLPPTADIYIVILSIVVLVFFVVDLIMCLLSKPGYPLSQFFWLDLITILSLILEVVYFLMVDNTLSVASLTRATRAAKLGSRVARIIRISKIIMIYLEKRKAKKEVTVTKNIYSSNVRKKFFNIIIFKIVLLVCAMQIVVSLLATVAGGKGGVNGGDLSQYILQSLSQSHNAPAFNAQLDQYLAFEPNVLYIQVNGVIVLDKPRDHLRNSDLWYSTMSEDTYTLLDNSSFTKTEAGYDLLLTLIVLLILYVSTWSFQRDVSTYFVQPVERMISIIESVTKMQGFAGGGENETLFLEDILSKMTALLRVGLGEAGTRIIALNLSRAGTMDPMIAGRKVRAVFAFCDLRNFSKAAEGLQEDVLVFVNHIALIVHNAVIAHGGAPNKNIGDAFLIVWKLDPKQNVADNAFLTFREIRTNMKRSVELRSILKRYIDMGKLPASYQVKLGFGFHIGWAIEGGIGSIHKVDASYLSEHVNLAARFESATKQYGTDVIFSQDFFTALSPEYQRVCRVIDKVIVKGSSTPVRIYSTLPRVNTDPQKPGSIPVMASINYLFSDSGDGAMADPNISDHLHTFDKAFAKYLEGNWHEAKELFEECQKIIPNDGPTSTLLKYIQGFDFIAPMDWQGFRRLVEK